MRNPKIAFTGLLLATVGVVALVYLIVPSQKEHLQVANQNNVEPADWPPPGSRIADDQSAIPEKNTMAKFKEYKRPNPVP